MIKAIQSLARRHSAWRVFSDFNEVAAISISNAVDLAQREKREERYMQIVGQYDKDEMAKFPEMFADVVMSLESKPGDVLGRAFHGLELHNKYTGQFFTPFEICRLMANLTLSKEDAEETISERGFIRTHEPCIGSGAMVIALALGLQENGINYQQHLHVTGVDVDLRCVHMAYIQLSLLHIPAIVVHGNSLTLEEYSHWYTPAHIMGGWNSRLRAEVTQ